MPALLAVLRSSSLLGTVGGRTFAQYADMSAVGGEPTSFRRAAKGRPSNQRPSGRGRQCPPSKGIADDGRPPKGDRLIVLVTFVTVIRQRAIPHSRMNLSPA